MGLCFWFFVLGWTPPLSREVFAESVDVPEEKAYSVNVACRFLASVGEILLPPLEEKVPAGRMRRRLTLLGLPEFSHNESAFSPRLLTPALSSSKAYPFRKSDKEERVACKSANSTEFRMVLREPGDVQ